MKRHSFAAALIVSVLLSTSLALAQPPSAPASRLRVATFNVWSGLDYQGTKTAGLRSILKFGEYESPERREQRFALLVDQLRALSPDIVFLQEANPTGPYAARLAQTLGYSEIHQVENGGVKLGPIGFPSNLKVGMVILARPSLHIRRHDVWKLSGPAGLLGDAVSLHFGEMVTCLVAKIVVNDTPVYLVNVHLAAAASDDESFVAKFRDTPEGRRVPGTEFAELITENRERNRRQQEEARKLVRLIDGLPSDYPVIVAGDFNAEPESQTMQTVLSSGSSFDALSTVNERTSDGPAVEAITWDAQANRNVAFTGRPFNSAGQALKPRAALDSFFDSAISRRLDYILLHERFRPEDVVAASVAFDKQVDGLHASDHYGIVTDIDISRVTAESPKETDTVVAPDTFKKNAFPMAMWDPNAGFGYGAKAFLLNPFGQSESFDLTAFQTTKGDRWYRFVFSLPDLETRRGKKYPLAVDVTVDYDKKISSNFFGVGNQSRLSDRVSYTREPLTGTLALSRGSGRTVGQAGVKYATISMEPAAAKTGHPTLSTAPDLGRRSYASLFGSVSYDSRDSYLNPSEGKVLLAEGEFAPGSGAGTVKFGRVAAWFQSYTVLFYPKSVLAVRFGGQSLIGNNLPVHVLLPLGGAGDLRGSVMGRYVDNSCALANAELRFPLVGRLAGMVGMDAGVVWSSLKQATLKGWTTNPTVGLRYNLKTFVVRMDVGFGRESTRFNLSFGHLF